MTPHKGIVVGIICLSLHPALAQLASAQNVAHSFHELQGTVKPGKTVSVTDGDGHKVQGKLSDLSAASLTLLVAGHPETFPEQRVMEVAERRRYAKRGALYGFLAGAGLAIISLTMDDGNSCGTISNCQAEKAIEVTMVPALGGVFAAIGAGIGAGISHDRLVYRAPKPAAAGTFVLTPFVAKHGAGVAVFLR